MDSPDRILISILNKWDDTASPTISSPTGKEEIVSRVALVALRGSTEVSLRKVLNEIRRNPKTDASLISKINKFVTILDKAHELDRTEIAHMLDLDHLHAPKPKMEEAKMRIIDAYLSGSKKLDLSDLHIKSIPDRASIHLHKTKITLYMPRATEPPPEADASSTDTESLAASGEFTLIESRPSSPIVNFADARKQYAKIYEKTVDQLFRINSTVFHSKSPTEEDQGNYFAEVKKILDECAGEKANLDETYHSINDRIKHDPYLESWIQTIEQLLHSFILKIENP